ncbi:hypothetical protein [Microbacterium enclense]|uniref:Uncharacterized protein n=1 Tax=Microbacterium enclense TaxID=993073 RepID=A0A1G6JDF4_9MICO|nr:hypothetical protein [Microbacterium enclense]SDC16693.1 hypothetical protein SAMN05216418_1790 [Microbacterium enclense]
MEADGDERSVPVASRLVHGYPGGEDREAEVVGGVVGEGGDGLHLPCGFVAALALALVVALAGVRSAHRVEVEAVGVLPAHGGVCATDELERGAVDADVASVAGADVGGEPAHARAHQRVHELVSAVALLLRVGGARDDELFGGGVLALVDVPGLHEVQDAVEGLAVALVPLVAVTRKGAEFEVVAHLRGGAGVQRGGDGVVPGIPVIHVHEEEDEHGTVRHQRLAAGAGAAVLLLPLVDEFDHAGFVDEGAVELHLVQAPGVRLPQPLVPVVGVPGGFEHASVEELEGDLLLGGHRWPSERKIRR